jgi:hypothetical protein
LILLISCRRPQRPPAATFADVSGGGGAAAARLRPGKSDITDANFPVDGEGRTYHLGTRKGEVCNRILSVGSEKRALMLAEYLSPPAPGRDLFVLESSRGFLTITGGCWLVNVGRNGIWLAGRWAAVFAPRARRCRQARHSS